MQWVRVDSQRPSRLLSPSALHAAEPAPTFEGADKIHQQLGLALVVGPVATATNSSGLAERQCGRSGRAAFAILTYVNPGSDSSDSDADGGSSGDGEARPAPRKHPQRTARVGRRSLLGVLRRSGLRVHEHAARIGTVTVSVDVSPGVCAAFVGARAALQDIVAAFVLERATDGARATNALNTRALRLSLLAAPPVVLRAVVAARVAYDVPLRAAAATLGGISADLSRHAGLWCLSDGSDGTGECSAAQFLLDAVRHQCEGGPPTAVPFPPSLAVALPQTFGQRSASSLSLCAALLWLRDVAAGTLPPPAPLAKAASDAAAESNGLSSTAAGEGRAERPPSPNRAAASGCVALHPFLFAPLAIPLLPSGPIPKMKIATAATKAPAWAPHQPAALISAQLLRAATDPSAAAKLPPQFAAAVQLLRSSPMAWAPGPCRVAFGPGQSSPTLLLHTLKLLMRRVVCTEAASDFSSASSASSASSSSGSSSSSSDSDDSDGPDSGFTRRHGPSVGDAMMAVLCGGCRFALTAVYTPGAPVEGGALGPLEGGIASVAGSHFFFQQLSHMDRLVVSALCANLAATCLAIRAADRLRRDSGLADPAQSSIAAAGTDLEAALLALQVARTVKREPLSPAVSSVAGSRGWSMGYVIRGLATDHPTTRRLDLVLIALGGAGDGAAGCTVMVAAFPSPSSGSGQSPSAAQAVLDCVLQGAGASGGSAAADTNRTNGCSESSSDDDFTLDDIQQGTCPVGSWGAAPVADGGMCGMCVGDASEGSKAMHRYGHEPAFSAVLAALRPTPTAEDKDSPSVPAGTAAPPRLSDAALRRILLVRRRRRYLLAAPASEARDQEKKQLKGTGHDNSRGGRFVIDPTAHWSPVSVACPNDVAVASGFTLRTTTRKALQVLRAEATGAASSKKKAARLHPLHNDMDAYLEALRAERRAAAPELQALANRIVRIEQSGQLSAPAVVDAFSGAVSQATPTQRLYRKLAQRERFLSVLTLQAPQPSMARVRRPITAAALVGDLHRYSARCTRAAVTRLQAAAELTISSATCAVRLAAGGSKSRTALSAVAPLLDPLTRGINLGEAPTLSMEETMLLHERLLVGSAALQHPERGIASSCGNERHLLAAGFGPSEVFAPSGTGPAVVSGQATTTHQRVTTDFVRAHTELRTVQERSGRYPRSCVTMPALASTATTISGGNGLPVVHVSEVPAAIASLQMAVGVSTTDDEVIDALTTPSSFAAVAGADVAAHPLATTAAAAIAARTAVHVAIQAACFPL